MHHNQRNIICHRDTKNSRKVSRPLLECGSGKKIGFNYRFWASTNIHNYVHASINKKTQTSCALAVQRFPSRNIKCKLVENIHRPSSCRNEQTVQNRTKSRILTVQQDSQIGLFSDTNQNRTTYTVEAGRCRYHINICHFCDHKILAILIYRRYPLLQCSLAYSHISLSPTKYSMTSILKLPFRSDRDVTRYHIAKSNFQFYSYNCL